ncbi:hypothetical protein PR202_gb09648 [Eleusine coracana subsp. coracana]|uniref:Uncharacterized protein n=1 Tax=Eleusine coracana subsp. coracana TaxID=191504 RepID=A0AAV5EH42_ELECO|nr:hypothetical protein PR202_gb09648 [Eleusine coracana subsp. coracana]
MGVPMDLDFHLLETASLFLAVLVTTFTLQNILGCFVISAFYHIVSFWTQSHSLSPGHSSIGINVGEPALNGCIMCFAGRIITLSEGTVASLLLRCNWHMFFSFETAWKYAFSAIE